MNQGFAYTELQGQEREDVRKMQEAEGNPCVLLEQLQDAEQKAQEQEIALRKAMLNLEEANADLEELNANLEEMVRQRTADLEAANLQLKEQMLDLELAKKDLLRAEKLASIGELVAGVAHEINTPLGIGVTAASFLETSVAEAQQAIPLFREHPELKRLGAKWTDTAHIILSNLERAARLIKSFKQVSVDRTSDPLRKIDLKEYLDELLVSLHPIIKRSRHLVLNEIPKGVEILTYPGAISQVLTNLVTNAVMHAFPHGETGQMSVNATAEDEMVSLWFRDNGKGISVNDRDKIFQPFFTTARHSGGSGLGLFIIQNLVTNRLHGTISCLDAEGGGTVFHIRFPKKLSEEPFRMEAD